jgi:hypothetical protein
MKGRLFRLDLTNKRTLITANKENRRWEVVKGNRNGERSCAPKINKIPKTTYNLIW